MRKKGAESLFGHAAEAKETRALVIIFLPEQRAPSPLQLHPGSGPRHSAPLFPGPGQALPETVRTILVWLHTISLLQHIRINNNSVEAAIRNTNIYAFQRFTMFYCVLQQTWKRLQKAKPATFHATIFFINCKILRFFLSSSVALLFKPAVGKAMHLSTQNAFNYFPYSINIKLSDTLIFQ